MNKREVIVGVCSAVVLSPIAAHAQQAGKAYRVGIIFLAAPASDLAGPKPVSPSARAFVQGLRALGYVEGQNLIVERRSAEGQYERFGDIVAELVGLKADVLVTVSDRLTHVAKAMTTTVPIVMTVGADPVAAGLVQSLAQPGGNVTDSTFQTGPEIDAKRLQILSEMVPGVSRVAFLASKEDKNWENAQGQSVRAAAQALGITLVLAEASLQQFTDAFRQISRAGAEALFVARSATAYIDRAPIVEFATRSRLPSSFDVRDFVELGGLMSYGANPIDNFRRAAGYVDKILKGAKPADLPVEQPTKFELAINLKTAKALGITVPPTLLARADEVIE